MIPIRLLFVGIILGFLVSFPLSPISRFSLLDLSVGYISILVLSNFKPLILTLKKDRVYKVFLLFLVVGLVSLVLQAKNLSFEAFIISLSYLIRLFLYSLIYPYIKILKASKKLDHIQLLQLIVVSGFCLSILGWLQYIVYPDLRNLFYLGWDPHYKRIFSTFFDPNYLGIYLVVCLSVLISDNYKQLTRIKYEKLILVFVFIATILFTYSRAAILLLLILSIIYVLRRRKFVVIPAIFLFSISSLMLLPRPGGEGVKLERIFSIEQRLDHTRIGWEIFKEYPVLGIGFDSLRYFKSSLGNSENWMVSHAGAGLDISLLVVLVTTGIIGSLIYIIFIYKSYVYMDRALRLSLFFVLISSFFINSLFFTPLMALFFILASI